MNADRYCFIVEWYDSMADLNKVYQLLYYLSDGSAEMFDVKNRRLFMRRTKVDIRIKDLYIGSIIKIFSRDLNIVDYGDNFTKTKLGSMNETTFGMMKPDAKNDIGSILNIIYSNGFIINDLKMIQLSPANAAEFYQEHRDKHFFESLISFISSGPIVVFILMGTDAVKRWRELMGPTDTSQAKIQAPSSIRAIFGTNGTKNACHGSDSTESASREINFFFNTSNKGRSTFTNLASTCCIIKPHAMNEGLAGKIVQEISEKFEISAMEIFTIGNTIAEEFYEVYKGVVSEYMDMISELVSGPFLVLQISQNREEDIVQSFRLLCGPNDPEIAQHLRKNTLRAKFGKNKVKNAIHCTDLPEDGKIEVEYFFKILSKS